jgi:uncharacterized protein (DUF58 family)
MISSVLATGIWEAVVDSGLKTMACYDITTAQAGRAGLEYVVLTCAIWSSSICLLVLLILVLFLLLLVQLVNSLLCSLHRFGLLRLARLLGEPLPEATGIDARCSIRQAHGRVPSVVLVWC